MLANDKLQKAEAQSMTVASMSYADSTVFRAVIQAIPYIGGSLDTLIAGHGSKIREQRVLGTLKSLAERLERLEVVVQEPAEQPELYDLILGVLEHVMRSASAEKRGRFVGILVHQIANNGDWGHAEAMSNLLAELDDLDVAVMNEAIKAPPYEPWEGLRAIAFQKPQIDEPTPPLLQILLPQASPVGLRLSCAKLLSRGLLHDELAGRWGGAPFVCFVPTDLADEFAQWIADET